MTSPEARTREWLEEAVVGLNLCPFARPVLRDDRLDIVVSDATTPGDAVDVAMREAMRLLDTAPSELATTLVVFPSTLETFETFLDVVATIDAVLEESGADAFLQLAHFHPDYRFADSTAEVTNESADAVVDDAADTPPDARDDSGPAETDVDDFTNRAPFPTLHLLRTADVADAIASHPDTARIPADNVARLRAMGRAAVAKIFDRF